MGAITRDLSYSLRLLVKRPWFTIAAVAVLSLGIGANTAVFSLVNAFLLKPLLIHNPEEIVGLFSRDTTTPDSYRGFSYPNYADIRDHNPAFASLSAHNLALVGVAEGGATSRRFADIVSSNFFETLGVAPSRGRAFSAAEERPGSGIPVAIVSYSYWKRLGAPEDLSTRTLRINGRLFNIVGVTPEGFTGTAALMSAELYVPLGVYEEVVNDFGAEARPLAERENPCLIAFGRLRPGLAAKSADARLTAVAAAMEEAYPAVNRHQALVVRPLSRVGYSTNPTSDSTLFVPAGLLLAMSAVVLLIAALNVANMMLARGMARRKEIAIRLAVGGGRRGIVQQLFIEGLVLALIGGAGGLFLSYGGTRLLVSSMNRLVPLKIVYHAGPDLRVLAVTMGFCLFSTILFGFWPAWNLSRPNLVADLKSTGNADPITGKRRRIFARRNLLVIAQISLSLMLLTTAGLFIRNSLRAAGIEPGFRMQNGIIAELDPSLTGYNEQQGRHLYSAIVDRLRTVPGVESVSLAAIVPFGMISLGRGIQAASGTAQPAKTVGAGFNMVGADYFRTLGIPLLRGREFRADDGPNASKVAIVDNLAAAQLWPKGDALGQHMHLMPDRTGGPVTDLEVVGVVNTVRDRLLGGPQEPHVYVSFNQSYQADMNVHLKLLPTGPDGEQRVLATVRQEIAAVDSRTPILRLKTLRGHMEDSAEMWIIQTAARMFAIFGGIALLLAVIGLYGVRAYSVARRTREIGIRMALGASVNGTQRLILREGVELTAAGASIGLVLSLFAGRAVAGMLVATSAMDPLVFATATAVLTSVSLLACYLPARRAARVDPMVALRDE